MNTSKLSRQINMRTLIFFMLSIQLDMRARQTTLQVELITIFLVMSGFHMIDDQYVSWARCKVYGLEEDLTCLWKLLVLLLVFLQIVEILRICAKPKSNIGMIGYMVCVFGTTMAQQTAVPDNNCTME